MPATSLVKFMNQSNGGGRGRIHWGRADIDGAPFRGPSVPLMTQDEADDRLVRVCDPHNRLFDLSVPTDNRDYMATMDKICNQWARMLFVKRIIRRNRKTGIVKVSVYMEWVEPYMEDGKPMHSQRPYFGQPNDD